MTKTICGFCFFDQGVHDPSGICPYQEGSQANIDSNAPVDGYPLEINLDEWILRDDGRYIVKT